MSTTNLPGSQPGRNRLSAGAIDLLIDQHCNQFLAVPRPVRDAAATIWQITMKLSPAGALQLAATAARLSAEDRGEGDK